LADVENVREQLKTTAEKSEEVRKKWVAVLQLNPVKNSGWKRRLAII
jgi:hypothetical protein